MTYTGSYAADRWLILNEDGTEFGAFSTQADRDEVLDALASRARTEAVEKDWLDDFDGDKPIYTDRELIDLLGSLLQAQVREQRINSVEELHGMLRHIGRSQRAALESEAAPVQQSGQCAVDDGGCANDRTLPVGAAPPLVPAVSEDAVTDALGVFSRWAIDVATLGELADLEKRLQAVGVDMQQVGRWSSLKDSSHV